MLQERQMPKHILQMMGMAVGQAKEILAKAVAKGCFKEEMGFQLGLKDW